jgi:hypothetical protein
MSSVLITSEKSPVNKNQGWELIQQKYKANEDTSRHKNPKKNKKQTINKNQIKTLCKVNTTQRKTKANNQQKSGKDPMQRGFMTMK